MTIHEGVQFLAPLTTVGLILLTRDRRRMNPPKVRITLGAVGLILATCVFFAVMRLLPGPWERGFSPFVEATVLVASLFIGVLLVLSLIEITGGAMQALKRRRYYRRSGS